MWNRILGKSSELDRKSSTSENPRRSESQRSIPRRSDSQKSTTSSRKTTRTEEHDRGFNPTSTSYSSTTQNRYPGTASASIASSYATALNDPTSQDYLPPGLVRNASLADQVPKTLPGHAYRTVALDSARTSDRDKDDPASMEEKPRRRERRGTREKDDERLESRSHRDKKRRNSEKGAERVMSTDDVPRGTSQRSEGFPETSSGTGSSSFVPEHPNDQSHTQSTHIQDQFPGQFPAQSAAPYRPPLAASEGGPGLAAEYYGDAGQSVVDQPGVRIHSPSLIVGAEPHLQAASVVAAPPPEPSASGGIGAAASFFDGTFSAGSDMEGHSSQKPAPTAGSSSLQYSSAAPSSSTYTTAGARPSSHQSASAPMIPTVGSAAAGAAAGYYTNNRPSKPGRPDQETSSTADFSKISESSSHHKPSQTHDPYSSYPSSSRPSNRPGKHSSQSSNMPLYGAGAAGIAGAAYHNHHGATNHGSAHYGPAHHASSHHSSHGQHYRGGSMAQQYRHRHQGPFSTFVDFFKDPDGVAQFEEYTEFIGVCRHCFDPHSSPKDAPRKHHYRRRRSDERFGSTVRVDKDHRYSSSESESRRRRKNKSWLGAGIAGYGLGKMGESLFLRDSDSHGSHSDHRRKVKPSHRRRSSSSSERKSRTSYGVVNQSSNTLSRKSHSDDRAETGITSDGKVYRRNSHGDIDTSKVKVDTSRHRSRSRSQDHHGNVSDMALGATLGSSVVASHSRRRSKSPKKAFVRSKHGNKESSSELASILKLSESDPRDSRRQSRHSPESRHGKDRRKEKKSRGFFSFSNSSSSSATSSDLGFGTSHDQRSGRKAKTRRKGKENRDAEAALLGLGAAALAFNQSQRPKRKKELIAVKESRGKHRAEKHGREGKRSSSSSEEDPWESASEGEYSSADSELAYGGSLHRRSQESLSSESSGLDKWDWRWGSKKQMNRAHKDRRHSSSFDNVAPVAASAAMMTGALNSPPRLQDQNNRMTSTSDIHLQHVYPMPTSDPTQFDVTRQDSGAAPYQPWNARPNPVPIQHPQPVAPVSSAVYTSQAPYTHSYSAPIGQSSGFQQSHSPSLALDHCMGVMDPRKNLPGAFPTPEEYFESSTKDPKRDPKSRRRDSSPVTHTPDYTSASGRPPRRRSLKDDASSVRFDLTKEQEDKDRRDERRRRKEEEKRQERLEQRGSDERRSSDSDVGARQDVITTPLSFHVTRGSEGGVRREPWAAPAAAGIIAAAIGATVSAEVPSNDKYEEERRREHDERDIEVIVRERPVANQEASSDKARGYTSQKTRMSVWQAAAKVKKAPSHTGYAAYFTPPELLSKEPGVKETVGANADNDVTVYQVPNMITIQPSEPRGHSPSRAYSFPITAEDMEHGVKQLPWAVPQLNLVEATPPTSRGGSVISSHSPRIRSPLSNEFADIPLEPLEPVASPDPSPAQPAHIEYRVIEPKGHSTEFFDSHVSDKEIPESVPGISSLKKKQKHGKKSPRGNDYGDDLDSMATIAAGLQGAGFNPSVVVDDPSFLRRDSPPGSEEDRSRRRPTTTVTEVAPGIPTPPSPPHGFVEEIDEPHMPGSFGEDEEKPRDPIKNTEDVIERSRSPEELTGPSDNADRKPNVYSTEQDAFKHEDLTNATINPAGVRPYNRGEQVKRDPISEDATEPSDNAGAKPYVYTAEPEPFESVANQNVAIDPMPADQRSANSLDGTSRSQPQVEVNTNGNTNVDEYMSDDAPSVAASAPLPSSRPKDSKSSKKSKRRSVGFDDNTSVISSPPTRGGKQDPSSTSKSGRKGGIFGLFSKSTDDLSDPKSIQQTPVEASLDHFEEPKERKKKSKSRRQDRDEEVAPVGTESVISNTPDVQDDWDVSKKSKRGKEKHRSSGDPGRITQDLPAQVISPASSGHDPFPTLDEMLTSLEDNETGHSLEKTASDVALNEIAAPSRVHDNQQPSFLGERPEKPPLPDTPDASEDPGGQMDLQRPVQSEQNERSPTDQSEPSTETPQMPNRSISDFQSDGRSVSFPSASPTAIPLRPLRFGRRPSSPGLAKSLPSTPQPLATADTPFTPRRRDRPHSTEFKSNEFRPMWLLEKYGARQEPILQETYPSLPSSHSTSRASSIHESDDLYRTEALDLALDEANHRRFVQEPRGLKIDTSHTESDPGLLDSQQATPTAASFQSMAKEGSMHPSEPAQPSTPGIRDLNPESVDQESSASAHHGPLDEPSQDQRLLHGVEDLFPQRQATSPSRYEAGVEARSSEPRKLEAHELDASDLRGRDGQEPTIPNAAAVDPSGDCAAALLKSSSQHDKLLEQSSSLSDSEQILKAEEELAPKAAMGGPERPNLEETRLMQEQDAQDAVDSWFAPAQSKRPSMKMKGRKRGKSYEETQHVSATEHSESTLGDTASTAEPREATLTGSLEDERSEPVADLNYQAALTSRRDSTKGKKKKGKRKTTDPPETPTESTSLFAEQHFDPDFIEKQSPILTVPSIVEPSSIKAIPPTGSPGLLAETEISPATEALHPALEGEPFVASTKKSKKGKKKNRSLSLLDPEQGQSQGANVPTKAGSGESESSNEVSEEVPYNFSKPEEPRTGESVDSYQAADRPPAGDTSAGFEQIGTPPDFNFEKSLEDRIAEVTSPVALKSSTSMEDLPLNQRSDSPAAAPRVSPKAIPLPLDDDLDLHGAPPESPVLQPIDVPSPGHEWSSEDRGVLVEEPVDSNSVLDRSLMEASNIEPTTLNRAISKLVLPQSAAATEDIKNEEDGNFSLSTTKKSKKDRKSKKSKGFQDPAFDAGPPAEESTLPTAISPSDEPEHGQTTIPDPIPRNEQHPEASDITDNPGGLPEEMIEAPQEQPADEWPGFTAKKTKKEKKKRKDISIREDPKGTDLDSSVSIIDPAPLESSSTATAPGVLPKLLEISDVEVPAEELKEVESTQFSPSKREHSELMREPAAPVNEVADEWPSVSKKKKKGKKGKGVQFDEISAAQPIDMESADTSEKSLATTGTATEVQDLLRGPALADSGRVAQNKGSEITPIAAWEEPLVSSRGQPLAPAPKPSKSTLEGINDTQLLASSSSETLSQERLPDPVEGLSASETTSAVGQPLPGADSKAIATTETANEVQEMLDRAEEMDTLKADPKTIRSPEQATEADDLAWASSKKKKKGKKPKIGEEAAAADIQKPHDQQTEDPPEHVLDDNQQNVPVDEFETEKSRKDKKGKRKGLSRSASDFEEAETQQNNPFAIEEPADAAMAMTDNAPSILDKPDQLPSLEMPKSPESLETMPIPTKPSASGTVSATKELEVSATTRDIDTDPNVEVSKPPIATEESSKPPPPVEGMDTSADAPSLLEEQDNPPSFEPPSPGFGMSSGNRASVAVGAPQPDAEETDIFVDAPSVLEKHDESSISELPLSVDLKHPATDRETATLGAPVDESRNNSEPLLPDYAIATVEPADTTPALQEKSEYAGAPALSVFDDKSLGASPGEESKEVPGIGVPIMHETTQPEIGPSFETPAKSREDKKSSKESTASAWEDDIPAVLESSTVPNEEQGVTDRNVEHPTKDTIADDRTIGIQALPVSKKGKKKGKKAKQSAWDDDVAETVTEDIEPLIALDEAGQKQPSEAIIEDTSAIDQEPSESKKDKKTSKISKAFGWEENDELSIQPATDSSQADVPIPKAEVENDGLSEPLEQSAEIAVQTPISKKGKKKGKKSNFMPWDEEEATVSTRDDQQQQSLVLSEAKVAGKDPGVTVKAPAEQTLEYIVEQPTPKKNKKMGKKSKFVDFDEEEIPSTTLENKEALLDATPLESAPNIKIASDTQQTELVEEVADSFFEPPKEIKKSGKSKFIEESSPSSPKDDASARDSVFTETDIVPGRVGEALEGTKQEEEPIDSFEDQSSKKGKKKGKRSKFVDWDKKPSIALPTDEIDRQKPVPTESEPIIEQFGDIQKPTEEGEAVVPADDSSIAKKGKKKGKKSKYGDWDEEPSTPLPSDEANQQEPVPTESESTLAEVNEPQPVEEQKAVVLGDELAIGKKKKKKGKQSKFLGFNDERSIPPVNDEPAVSLSGGPQIVDRTPSDLPTEEVGVLQSNEDLVTRAAKSKRDKKNAKKVKALSWDEQLPSAAEEPLLLETEDLSRALDPSASKLSDEMMGDVSEPVPAEQIEQLTATETKGLRPDSPVFSKAEATEDTDILPDASLEMTEATKNDEEEMPAGLPATVLGPDHGAPDRPPTMPSTHVVAVHDETMQDLAHDNADLDPYHGLEQQVHAAEDTVPPQPFQNVSPLLLQADDVHVGPQPPLSTEATLDVAEAETQPTPPEETIANSLAASDDILKESSIASQIAATLEDPELSDDQKISFSPQHNEPEPQLSANVPFKSDELLQTIQAEGDEAAEEFAFVSKKDKKKAKKSKKAVALEDEVLIDVQDENATIDERVQEEGLTFDQPIAEPTNIPEEAPEDHLPISRKEKKKSKRKNKPSYFGDEPSGSTTLVEPDLKFNAVVEDIAEEPILPPEPTAMEETGDPQPLSKKDKKKGKKGKQALDFFDEPSPSTPQADIDPKEGIADQTVDEPFLPTEPSISEEFGPTPSNKKEKKKSKKTKSAFVFDEGPSVDTASAEPSLDDTPNANDEQPALPIEPDVTATDASFLDSGTKGKKKSTKNRKAPIDDRGLLEKTMPTESEPEPETAIDGPVLSAEPSVAVAEENFPEPMKKSKKSKKDKKAFNFNDELSKNIAREERMFDETSAERIGEPPLSMEPVVAASEQDIPDLSKKGKNLSIIDDDSLESTTSVEPVIEKALAEQIGEPSFSPGATVDIPVDDSPDSSKNVETSKRGKKAFDLDDEPSEKLTLVEPEKSESNLLIDQQLPGPTELSFTEAIEVFPTASSKKDKIQSKKANKEATINDELSDITIPAKPEGLEQDVQQPPVTAEASIAEAPEELFRSNKDEDKKSEKNKKSRTFGDEVLETSTSVEPDTRQEDLPIDLPPVATEASIVEALDVPTASGKKGKESKKNKKAVAFDDEVESAPLVEPANPQRDVGADKPPVLTDTSLAEATEEFPVTPSKKDKKSKKDTKTHVFEDGAPSEMPLPDIMDPITEGIAVPADPSAPEAVDDFWLSSKKDRKKAKKGKKAVDFDEPAESIAAADSNVPSESIGIDVPEDFITETKKDKKRGKKAKKAMTWDDETLETRPVVEEATTLDEPSQAAPLPSVSQLERSEPAEIFPRASSPNLPAQSDDTNIIMEEQPIEEAPTVTATAEVDKPVERANTERATDLEIKQSDTVLTSKQSKKAKKAKKSQAFKWDDDENTANPPPAETATSMKDITAPLPEIQEGQPLEIVSEEAGLAVPPSVFEAPEQMRMIEPLAASQVIEQVRAPRHQDPTLATPASIDIPSAVPPSPSAKEPFVQQENAGTEQVQEPVSQPVASTVEPIEDKVPSTARETSLPNDEEFTSFAPTKKSKKGKKGKKQVIEWEDETIPPSEPVQEPSKAAGVTDVASRPEMMAWPTEVRLNQTSATFNPEDQPISPIDVVQDPSVSQDQYLADEPQEPAPVEDDRSDYFGHEPSRDLPSQPQPFEDNSLYAPPSPAQLPSTEAGPTKIKRSSVHDDVSVDTSRKETDLPASAAEQAQPQDMTARPVDGFEDLATIKKEKKAKKKKKQALDDVLWEFPSIPPTTEVRPVESMWPSDPSRGDRLHIENPQTVSTNEPQDPAGSERITQADFAAAVLNEQASEIVVDTPRQVGMEGEPAMLEELRVEDAMDEDPVAVSKKAKKGKKSKKSKSTDYFAETEPDTQEAAKGSEEIKDPSRLNDRQSSPGVGSVEAIAAAAAVSAGLSTAPGFSRKEPKEDKTKKKDRQASSAWTEQVEDIAPRGEAAIEDSGLPDQSRIPTPKRRSPIQTWHQNISPSQSPRHSELYDIEDEQPRSAASIQRKRSHDDERRQSHGAERRSPIQAWHQYDTPGQSPRHSELYDYDPSESRAAGGRASAGAINRDSAVHVSDSPIVSQQSPVRRAMRDSGYPETEASPIVSQGAEKQEDISEHTRNFRQGDRDSVKANPLQILSEDTIKRRQQKKRTRSRSPSRHDNDTEDLYLPPRHPRPDSFEDVHEPSPVSSTTKDRSSVLFQSSPSTREEQTRREEKGDAKVQGSPVGHGFHQEVGEQSSHPAGGSLTPPREDNSAMVNARAESLAALSGLRGVSEEQGKSLFGGPVGISSDDHSPETPMDGEGLDRRRLNTITEYDPEESPLHKKNRDVSDVGVSAHGVKAARRSGTPQAISKRRARSPLAEGAEAAPSTDDAASRPFWPSIEEEKQPLDVERSRSRNTEQRPSSHQSNISSLVSGPPKQREYERRSFSGASNHSIESINAIIRTPPDQMRSASGMSNRSSGTPPLRRADRSVSSDLRGANRKSEAKKRANQPEAEPQEVDSSISTPLPSATPNDSTKNKSKGRVKGMADVFVSFF